MNTRRRKGNLAAAALQQPPPPKQKQKPWPCLFRVCGDAHFNGICTIAFFVSLTCLVAETVSPTSYGRFGSSADTFSVSPRLGWFLMELPCTLVFLFFFFVRGGSQSQNAGPRAMAALFCCHYLYRGWYFPYNIHVRTLA